VFGKRRRKSKSKKASKRSKEPARIGRYTILELLGQGGMGCVYLGHDPVIDRNVAIKVISLRNDMPEEEASQYRERFLREAQAAGALQHPNIVAVHDIGQDPACGRPYIVMEYVPGEDLKKVIRAEAPLPPWRAIRITMQIASALDYAHGRGIVHRDIKPANALIGETGQVKIADFGVARVPDSELTQTDQFVGSPGFISPEQLQGGAVDGRSDLFSLGVILYLLLTGRSPFQGDSPSEVLYRISNQPAQPPRQMLPRLPAEFDAILEKALSKDPNQRYQTGRQFMEALIALETSGVVTAVKAAADPEKESSPEHDAAGGAARPPRPPSPWMALNSQWRLATLLGGLLLAFVCVNAGIYFLMHGPLGRIASASGEAGLALPGSAGSGSLGMIGGTLPMAVPKLPEEPIESICAMSYANREDLLRIIMSPPPTAAATAPGAETASLRVELDHQLTSGRLIVVVGGKTALSKPFDAPDGANTGAVSHMLSVPSGRQGVEVQVLGEAGEVRATSRINGTMKPDTVAVLRVVQRKRSGKGLTLHWASQEESSKAGGSR
jgi:serine/threonine-protein kinase